jgi:flagellar motor switch protein FliN/FliY
MASNVVNRLELAALAGESHGKVAPLGERLDLVGHVKVKLTAVLGGAELSVAKLFALTPNEVLELDRAVDAPVDIRLNDKVIARGALVAVGDNFGVRISEVLPE